MSDIVVIGGGIAGLSAAARLAPHARVTVLEAEDALGHHASGRSAALFEQNYGLAPIRALSRASADFQAPYLSPRGLLLVARAGEEAAFEADRADLGLAEVDLATARAHVPILNDTVTRAAYHADAQDIDTDRMLQDFARTVRSHGGSVVTGARVTAIHPGWRVETTAGAYDGNRILNAAGAWADVIARMAGVHPIGIEPFRRSMARIPAPGDHDVSRWPMLFGVGESWYAKPDAGALLVSPADEDPAAPQDAWADDLVVAHGLDRYMQHVTEPVARVTTSWAGLRSFAPDRVLVLGPDGGNPDFIWCAGQGGYGFQTAPAASQLVADLTLGHAPSLDNATVDALAAKRFSPVTEPAQ